MLDRRWMDGHNRRLDAEMNARQDRLDAEQEAGHERLDAEVVVSRRVMAVMRERLELAMSKLRHA